MREAYERRRRHGGRLVFHVFAALAEFERNLIRERTFAGLKAARALVSASGELVPLGEQDRGACDAVLLAEGHHLARERLAAGVAPDCYQILAAINAVHTSARHVRDTDRSQVVALYVVLNRAVAVAELDGPEVAPAAVDRLEDKLAGLSHLPCDPRRTSAPRRTTKPVGLRFE